MKQALISIDFINEIVHSEGKLAGKGYHAFAKANNTLDNLAKQQNDARATGTPVIHVHLGFGPGYADHPQDSPLLGAAAGAGILQEGTWSTEICAEVAPVDGEYVLAKKRISPFFGTSLELTLRSLGIGHLLLAGVATDIAVQSAVRDAHDRDFKVTVLSDSCAAADAGDHQAALDNMSKIAEIC